MGPAASDQSRIRRAIITALASDDLLFDILVLKGGNALAIAHGIGDRATLDLDYAVLDSSVTPEAIAATMKRVLGSQLQSEGLVVFDLKLVRRIPKEGEPVAGCRIDLKVVSLKQWLDHDGPEGRDALRRSAMIVGPENSRTIDIELSYSEAVPNIDVVTIDAVETKVYAPLLIVIEKLRALCQQLPEYPRRAHKTPRSRDYYDICAVLDAQPDIDLASDDALAVFGGVFAAKAVPLALIGRLGDPDVRNFHGQNWPEVVAAVAGRAGPLNDYIERVMVQVARVASKAAG